MSKPRSPVLGPVVGNLLVAVADDRRTALIARQTRLADRGSFHAVVLRAEALPLVLVEVAIPVGNDRWEYRSSGLWVEAVCEDPGVHWSYGLEAFALALDQPDELLGRGYGHRTPLGWELDFVAATDPAMAEPAMVEPVTDATTASEPADPDPVVELGRIDGLLLTAPVEGGELPLAGAAWRASWSLLSPDPWPVALAAPAGEPTEVALPIDGVGESGPVWWVGHDGETLTSRLDSPPVSGR